MGEAVTKRPRPSRVLLVGLVSSGLAAAALEVTCLADNRELGFGWTISKSEQRLMLLIATLFFVGFAIANLVKRRAYGRRNS